MSAWRVRRSGSSGRRLWSLEERPLNEITVKLIVERCGINRKTFYNHYRDIPDLMEKILTDEVDAIMARYTQVDSIEECLGHAIEFALQHKRAALHIYRSVGRDVYVESTLKLCDYLVRTYLAKVDGRRRWTRRIMKDSCGCIVGSCSA